MGIGPARVIRQMGPGEPQYLMGVSDLPLLRVVGCRRPEAGGVAESMCVRSMAPQVLQLPVLIQTQTPAWGQDRRG